MQNCFVVIIFFFLISCSSNITVNCEEILHNEPYFSQKGTNCSEQEFQHDFDVFMDCGGLEEADEFYLQSQILGSIMIHLLDEKKNITYSNVIESINNYKSNASHEIVLKIYEAKKQLADRIVEIDKFESVIPILLQGGFPEIDIQNFKAFIVENELSGKTYVKVLEDWKLSKLHLKQDNYDKINFSRLIDIPTAIAQSKEKNKMIFILFTGYSCEECMRLETNILSAVNISKVLAENFVSFIAYVDDKSKIQGSEISRGMQLSEIQKEYFNSFTQPAMYILNTEGKIISELTNVKTINQFSEWLENKY